MRESDLSKTAQSLPRLRKNYNIHPQLDDPVQRLFNAMEPATYVRPHRHPSDDRWEFFQIVSGRAAVLTFDQQGTVRDKVVLSQSGPNIAIEIPGKELVVPWAGVKFATTGEEPGQNELGSGLIAQYQKGPDGKVEMEIVYPFDVATKDMIYPFKGF